MRLRNKQWRVNRESNLTNMYHGLMFCNYDYMFGMRRLNNFLYVEDTDGQQRDLGVYIAERVYPFNPSYYTKAGNWVKKSND